MHTFFRPQRLALGGVVAAVALAGVDSSARSEHPRFETYFRGGGAHYSTAQFGNNRTRAYSFGVDTALRSWFSLDLGWIDLGSVTVDTGGELFAPTIWVGQGGRVYAARAVYAVPTLRWPLGPFEFDAGVGPAWVDSRARSRLYSIFDRSVYSQADTHRDLEWLYRLGFRWRVNDSLALKLHGQ